MSWLLVAVLLAGWLAYRIVANRRLRRPPVVDREGRPYPDVEVTLSGGETVRVLDAGSGPAMLLVPGADGVRETWRWQVPEFARRFRVLAPDLRSEVPVTGSFDLFGHDLAEVLDARGVKDAVVVGQSLGGAIAQRFAVLHPERVRALVVVNSLARVAYGHVGLNRTLLVPVAMATTRYLPTILARWFGHFWSRFDVWVFDRSPGGGRVVDYVLRTGPRTVPPSVSSARVALLRGEDLRPQLDRIDAPTLVVKGPRDTYVPVAWSREIAARIPGASYAEIPGSGHVSHVSMPDAFNRTVLDWLESIGEPPDSGEVQG